uniref:ECRG4 augurin n=1 Tax=Callithrix jacchus TaxID=9483 RepID=A0A8I3X9X7_CALJA
MTIYPCGTRYPVCFLNAESEGWATCPWERPGSRALEGCTNHSLCFGDGELMISAPVPTKTNVAVDENKAKEFLGSLKRQKRQLWDRTRPEVQQWYQQFLYMGFDEAKFEDDITYWLNRDRNGHEYYGDYYQRHYDEDSAIGPRSPYSFRHGASVNYEDY